MSSLFSGLPTVDDGTGAGAKLANAKWFTTDITNPFLPADMSRKIIFNFAVDISAKIEYTLDNINWVAFNGGNPVGANNAFQFDFMMRKGDTLNIRAALAVTVIFARVDTQE